MHVPVREYEYRAKWWILLFITVFFGLCALFLGLKATENNRGVVIGGIIELGPTGATIFYWVLVAFSLIAVISSVAFAYQRLRYRRRIVLSSESIQVPANGWTATPRQINFHDVQTLSVLPMPMFAGRVLTITHTGGSCIVLSDQMPSRAAFDELYSLLSAAVEQARANDRRPLRP